MARSRFERPRFLTLPWRSRAAIARDVDAELSFHLEMRTNELMAQGLGSDEARRRATEEFGDIEFTRAYCRTLDQRGDRAARAADWLAEWRQDAHYAFRTLRRSPGFAIVSLVTLALAIGANSAIFTVARAVLLKPLPYGAPNGLVTLFESWPGRPSDHTPVSPANFVDYKAQQHSFVDMAPYLGLGSVTWRAENADPAAVSALAVAPNLFGVLQVPALRGRTFTAGEDAPGANLVVVISYAFWQRAFGGDVASIGRRISLNGRSYELIGVMPRDFTLGLGEDLWMPLDLSDATADPVRSRKQHYLHVVGRLAPGMTIDAARADLLAVARRLAAEYPEANTGRSALLLPLHEVMTGNLRPALLLLQGAAAMVLLIACANLANLTLSRTLGRRRELALRAALGAGRARLVRQLIAESVLLALAGGAIGVGLAVVATRALLSLNPDALPAMFSSGVDVGVLAFSLGLSVATGLLFGLVPALDAARANLHDALKEGGRSASGGRGPERVRRALVVAQVGLAVMLLVGAGLLVRSFGELARVQLGFDPDHVLTAQLRASGAQYDSSSAINHFYDGVLDDVAHAPGVVAVGAMTLLPTGGAVGSTVRVEGEPVDERNLPEIGYVAVRGELFKAMRIPILAGRAYDATDLASGPKTTIVNEAAAKRFFPAGDAVGRRIRIGPNPNGEWMTIVGVAGDIRNEGPGVPARPMLYANHRQEAWDRSLAVVVRTAGDPQTAAPALRRAVRTMDPSLAIRDIKTLNDVVGASLAPRRFALGLAACFAAIALLLAAIGIYGVLAYMVATRTRELGVRIALGATWQNVLGLVMRQGLGWSLLGLVVGVAGSIAGGRALGGMLFGVSPLDLPTYATVAIGLLIVVGVACAVPARRATRVDPLTSMRAE
ncbi:MAG: permease [Gemmatimonadetes bacterium]|nr:permease [Gemmatimonadota bacterium]